MTNSTNVRLKVYDDPKEFWDEVSPSLKAEEAKNSLCLGRAYVFRSNPEGCLYQSAIFDGDNLLGAIVVSRYRTNANFLPAPVTNPEHARKLFESFQKSRIAITGIVGDLETAKTYQKLLEEHGFRTKVHMRQGI